MYPVEYEVEVYNMVKEAMEIRHGVTMAENFADAMEKIEDYYGNDINKVTMILLEEATVYDFENTNNDFSHGMFKIGEITKW